MRLGAFLTVTFVAASLLTGHAQGQPAPVSVNTATASELRTLKGIGKARAAAIIDGRPYETIDQLETRKILPHGVFLAIRARLSR